MKRLILLTLVAFSLQAHGWTIDSLLEYHNECPDCQTIYNPDGILSKESEAAVLQAIHNIKEAKIRFIVVNSLDPLYYSRSSGKDIHAFVEFFLQAIEPQESERRKTVTILYAIKDRKYKWRTGADVRKFLPDKKCDYIAESIKSDLKSKHYREAFVELFNKINGPMPFDWAFWLFWGGIVIVILAFCIWAYFDHLREEKLSAKIRTIKQVNKSPEKINLFIEQNCVICFEELDNSQLKKDQNETQETEPRRNTQGYARVPLEENELPEKKEKKADAEPSSINVAGLKDLEAKESVFLECGHNFHAGCLNDWVKKSKTCPICRVKFEAQQRQGTNPNRNNNQNLLLDLLLLNDRHGYGRDDIMYYYDNGKFRPSSSGSSGGSSGGSFDFGSGGTSGGW